MSATTLVSVKEYLATTRDPDCDYMDGEILERNRGETEHGGLQAALTGWLYANRKRLGIHVFTETRVQVKPARFRIPDIWRVPFFGTIPVQSRTESAEMWPLHRSTESASCAGTHPEERARGQHKESP
jgi:hypothetical protein